MVGAASASDGVFLKSPPAWRGLARIENPGAGAENRIDKTSGQRGHSGQALHEIQRAAFGGEQRAGRALDSSNVHSRRDAAAIGTESDELDGGGDLAEGDLGEVDSCHD